jgi:tetratricopeptide (TPR) repeat protein
MMKKRLVVLLSASVVLSGCIPLGSRLGRAEAQAPASQGQVTQSAIRELLDKASDLETRGRRDLAIQTWQQILLADPRNVEALKNLVRATRLSGDAKLSDTYERQLRTVSPTDAAESAPVTPAQDQLLQQAAKLADEGKYAPALTIFRHVFGMHPPLGDWAGAYYETEAATDGGRAPAIEGLRDLAERYPSEPRYQIALGRVLTYSPATREEGRRYLEKFPADPKAAQALRQSLIWDAANPAAAPQIQAYLATHQDPQLAAVFQISQSKAGQSGTSAPSAAASTATSDSGIASGIARPSQPSPRTGAAAAPPSGPSTVGSDRLMPAAATQDGSPARGRAGEEVAAYEALNSGHLALAETRFKAILSIDPSDSRALAGLGYVRMQQGNFLGAISYLEQAKRSNPEDKPLSAALDTARFWFIMGEGQSALKANDLATAEKRYRAALELRPASPEALEGLGGTLLKEQQPSPAIGLFTRAVTAKPDSADGWRGLFLAQFQSGNPGLALSTLNRIPAATLAQLMGDPLFLQSLGSAYSRVGREAEAEATLESALKQTFPPDVDGLKKDIQLQLAGMLASNKQPDQAAALYRQILGADPASVPAWRGLVALQHATGHDTDALKTVQSIPPATYATAMRDPGFEITVASVYEANNKPDQAQTLLQNAVTEQNTQGRNVSPETEMELANTYVEQGKAQLAYPVYQQVLRDDPTRAAAWAGLLSALHATGHDKEAAEQLKLIPPTVRTQLEADPKYLQTMAGVYAALGRSREATMFLGRVEQDDAAQKTTPPAAIEIQNAQLLYNGMEDSALYRELMSLGARTDLTAEQRHTVQTIWANWAARRANQLAAAGNPRQAVAILNAAAETFTDNPAAIRSLAPGYLRAGAPHEAVLIYRTQKMDSANAADYEAAVGAALADGDNKDAESWTRSALAAYPADPQILMLAAKVEQQRGDTAKAMRYYQESLKAMPPASSASKLSTELGLPAASGPPSLPGPDHPVPLSTLLAPDNPDVTFEGRNPYQPGYPSKAPLPPFDSSSRLSAPEMSNPNGKSTAVGSPASTNSAAAPSAVRNPATAAGGQPVLNSPAASQQPPANPAAGSASSSGAINMTPAASAASQPAPPTQTARPNPRSAVPSAVAVQLGDNSPRPVQPQADVTDVLPTARYSESAKARQAEASHAEVEAARADRIRRMQEDSAARTGQSHPPPSETITVPTENAEYVTPAAPQVPRPSAPALQTSRIPDTGAQQYPQPRTQPAPPSSTITRPRRVTQPPSSAAAPEAVTPRSGSVQSQPVPIAATPSPAAVPPPTPAVAPLEPTYPVSPPPTDAELRARNIPLPERYFEAQAPLPLTPRQQAENELASLEGSYSGWLGGTGSGRFRSGYLGLDRLYDLEAPAEASAVFGRAVRLTAVATPVFLDSGLLNTSSFVSGSVPYLGTQPANRAGSLSQQFSNGIGGELQLTAKTIGLAVGYTPYEFLVHNITGRAWWSTLGGHLTVYGDRQPVKDTQLSYSGLYDPGASSSLALRPIWGGVIANTGGARFDLGSGTARFYISGEGGVLTGAHVLQNQTFGGSAGVTLRVGNWPGHGNLVIGGDVTGKHYEYNEVGLSYGQGGYFSPDTYFLASVPVTFIGQNKTNFHYSVSAALGVRTFEQAEAPFFPLDPTLQNGFVPSNGATCNASQTPSINCGEYPLTDTTAFNYWVRAQVSYRFADHWYGGGFLDSNNSNNYNTVTAGFFFRYVFRAQHSIEGYPAGMFRVDGLRPLQIP